jgi:hypothetical protein
MPSPDEKNANTVVIDMARGWIYVKIVEPKPEPDRIERLLGLTIEQWFNAHPQFVIDKTVGLTEHGTLHGINVWYHVDDRQHVPVNPEPPQQVSSLAIEVHHQIREQLPTEHIEALIDEAMKMCRSHQDGSGTTFVISPRRIAVVLDKQANRGAVLPVDFIYPTFGDASRATVLTWLEAPPSRLHVIQIAESWFMPGDVESRKIKIIEPAFMRTKMTYDAEWPPEK